MILLRRKKAISNIATLLAHVFGAHSAIRNSFPGLALGMGGEKVEQEPFPLLSRREGKPGEHQQWGGYHARPANKRKTEMSDTIETQNDDLFAPVSFGGGGSKSSSSSRSRRHSVTRGGGNPYNSHASKGPAGMQLTIQQANAGMGPVPAVPPTIKHIAIRAWSDGPQPVSCVNCHILHDPYVP